MLTQTINISSQEDLVGAYEALREAVLSSGASAAAPVDGRRLLTEGLLSWGRHYTVSRCHASALSLGRGVVPQGVQTLAEQPQAAVVHLMATMPLQSIDHLEAISCVTPMAPKSKRITSAARLWCMSASRPCTRSLSIARARHGNMG